VPFIPNVHVVLSALEVIRPHSRLDESASTIVTHGIDRLGQLPEMHRCVGVQLIETNLGDGCR
jgi:hypothetical protein